MPQCKLGALSTDVLSTANQIQLTGTGCTLAFGKSNTPGFISGQITGVGGIYKDGTGTTLLNNASNNYTGGTTVVAGTLTLNGAGLSSTGFVTVQAGTFNVALAATVSVTIGDLSSNGGTTGIITLGNKTLVTGTSTQRQHSAEVSKVQRCWSNKAGQRHPSLK